MKKGTIMKLSSEGLDYLTQNDEGKLAKLCLRRFEYRSRTRKDKSCLTVMPIGKHYYESYHESFLEPV